MKKILVSFLALFFAHLLFVRMSCGRISCSFPTEAMLTPYDNADSIPHQLSTNGTKAKTLLLELDVQFLQYQCRANPLSFSSAYATKSPGTYITRIDLVSDRDFDAFHPAGTDLKDLFAWPDSNYLDYYTPRTRFYLIHDPTDTGTHIFTVTLHTPDSGKVVTAFTQPVKILL